MKDLISKIDPSKAPQVMLDLLEAKQNFDRECRLPPGPQPPVNRRNLVSGFEQSRSVPVATGIIRQTYIGMEKHSSSKPLASLTRIRISDMQVRKVHLGHYLLCRIISPAIRNVAVTVAIEDPNGDAQTLSLYNYPGTFEATTEYLDELLPLGTVLAIREPTLKMTTFSRTHAQVRVDSPSDVLFVYPDDPLAKGVTWKNGSSSYGTKRYPASTIGWKSKADQYFKKGWFVLAASTYSRGLHFDPSAHSLRLNRSMAYLRLEWWRAALADCDHLLGVAGLPTENRVKAIYRAGQAEYGQQNWEAAKRRYEAALKEDRSQTECRSALERTKQRINESTTGKYDWISIFRQAQKPASRIDAADYTGPIEVFALPNLGGGRGVRAKRTVKAGEILVVCKAFTCAFSEDLSQNENIITANFLTDRTERKAQVALLHMTAQKLAGNPSYVKSVCDLYAGPGLVPPPSSYTTAQTDHYPAEWPLSLPPDVDIARTEAVLTFNTFSPCTISLDSDTDELLSYAHRKWEEPAALYLLPSLFNHACNNNSQVVCCGDLMVIRALHNVPAGTELTVSYGGGLDLSRREKSLAHWLRRCDCSLCLADRLDGKAAREKRDKIWNLLNKDTAESTRRFADIPLLKSRLEDLDATYWTGRTEIRPALFDGYLRLAYCYNSQKNPMAAIPCLFQALEAVGIEVTDKSLPGPIGGKGILGQISGDAIPISTKSVPAFMDATRCVHASLMIAALFILSQQDLFRGVGWLRAAWWIEKVLTGGYVEIFEARHKLKLKEYGLDLEDFAHKVFVTL